MLEIKELQDLIIEWAKEKNLNDPDKQYLKILEEVGETARAILKNDIPEIKDGIGDIAVTVIIYYWQLENSIRLSWVESIERKECIYFSQLIHSVDNLRGNEFHLLNDIAFNYQTDLKECLNLAWNEIKDRKGKTLNGTFIKTQQ